MDDNQLEDQLRRLLTGLADQAIVRGEQFIYDGGELYADDVAEIGLLAVLCIAQALSERAGLGGFGYEFQLAAPANPVFPIHASAPQVLPDFFKVAPFVSAVFHNEVLNAKQDLTLLYHAAVQRLRASAN
ncbi:hypothetical protein I5S53_04775 [Pseudomonas juntendi]|uniref:hypothetical protein n=1 Tax=Pseudomonas TaxID=286 RepID=UPI000D8C09D7|nr:MULTISPECIES: hypothetical protein [Pseudomonas]MBH3383292.1 hypothetical protein [Pseudomonas juntendi]PYC07979.1 hypothetical protein DMX12_04940 [Pseudomonas sp. MB-090624]WBM32205.1 hypothetical protein M2J80_22160 [Pseudomonas sp. NY11382]